MPAPTVATFSATALVTAHTALRNLIDGGTGAGSIKIRDSSDVLLAQIPLPEPCGTINGTTGQLTFDVTGASDTSADADGTAAYAEFCDGSGVVYLSLPATFSTAAVSGFFAMSTLSIVSGGTVELLSATVG